MDSLFDSEQSDATEDDWIEFIYQVRLFTLFTCDL